MKTRHNETAVHSRQCCRHTKIQFAWDFTAWDLCTVHVSSYGRIINTGWMLAHSAKNVTIYISFLFVLFHSK